MLQSFPDRRNKLVSVVLTRKEAKAFKMFARREGRAVSGWLRHLGLKDIRSNGMSVDELASQADAEGINDDDVAEDLESGVE